MFLRFTMTNDDNGASDCNYADMIIVSTEHLEEIHSLLVVRSHHSLQGKASQLVIIPCKERHHILSCKDCHFLCNRRLHDLCPRRIVMRCQHLHSTYLPLSCEIIITYLSCKIIISNLLVM